jgi:hypothetical protein
MKITVPTTLADITLERYLMYLQAIKEAEKHPDENYLEIKKIEIFCNLKYIDVLNIEYTFIKSISERIDQVLKQEPKLVVKFKLEGIEFGFHTNLDKLPYGEFLDLNANISDWQTIVVSMGVLYRPIVLKRKDKYIIEKYKGDRYHKVLMQMPMDAVVGAMVFFWNLGLDCTTFIVKHLEANKMMNLPNNHSLLKIGDGMQQSMNLLTETLQSIKK